MERLREYITARIVEEDCGHPTPCWRWQRHINEKGYGYGELAGFGHFRVHRMAYRAFIAPIPDGMVIDHLCRVRDCCNPEHLDVVTRAENTRRGNAGKSQSNPDPSLCPHGHRWTPENTYWPPSGRSRVCKECHREIARRSIRKARERSRA